jgi:hypothetical protein
MTDVVDELQVRRNTLTEPTPQIDNNKLGPGAVNNSDPSSVFNRLGEKIGAFGAAIAGTGGSTEPPLSKEQVQELRQMARDSKATEPEIADELSIALGLAHRIRSDGYQVDLAYERLKFIFECLTAENAKLTLARDERVRLQLDIYKHAGIVSRMLAHISSGSSAALVIAALATSMLVWAILVLVVRLLSDSGISSIVPDLFFMNGRVLTVVASGAFLGGIISIVSRLREFSRVTDLDPFAMFWTAMLKPLIGVVLAVFILATLAGGIISFGFLGDFFSFGGDAGGNSPAKHLVSEKNLYILWTLAFLAGFSERFAWDFVDRAQGVTQTKATGSSAQKI